MGGRIATFVRHLLPFAAAELLTALLERSAPYAGLGETAPAALIALFKLAVAVLHCI